mgnify:CR=1 FL=1|jgi:hypothetical protein
MDYKYIEQLVERYFQCETTLQEEQILLNFFAQEEAEVPTELRQYQPIFAALEPKEKLSADFTDRILALTEGAPRVKARTVSLSERMRPLLRAAAIVAVILAFGQAIHFSTNHANQQADDINYANYKDTYDDPSMAYDQMEDALQLMREGFSQARQADSLVSVLTPSTDTTLVK